MFKMMIVEDEKKIREGLATGFDWESLGFQICYKAKNGADALTGYKEEEPDVIMTDIRMPVMDGFEMMEHIYKENKNIKFIVLSGYDDFEYARKSIHFGVISYLLKPVNESELYPLMRKIHQDLTLQKQKKEDEKNGILLLKQSQQEIRSNKFLKLLYGNLPGSESAVQILNDFMPEANPGRMNIGLIAFRNQPNTANLFEYLVRQEIDERLHFLIDGDYVLFTISGEDEMPADFEITTAKKIYKELEKGYSDQTVLNSIVMTLSKQASGIRGIQAAYREAADLLRYSFYCSPGKIIQDSLIQNRKAIPSPAEISTALAVAINSDNRSELDFRLKEYRIAYSMQFLPKDMLIFKCVEIFLLTARKLENINISLEEEKLLYEKLANITEIDSFSKEITRYFYELFQQNVQKKLESAQSIIQKVEAYIVKNYDKNLSLNFLAEVFHINASYLSALFCKKTNVPLTIYIRNVRIQKAKNLLTSSDYTINEIAQMVGFKEYRHFCTVFKNAAGCTPKSFRTNSITHG